MRTSSLLATLALAATAAAQSPLTTTFAGGNGQDGNMFDLVAIDPAGVTVDYFDVNLDAGTWDMEVYVLTTPGNYLPSVNTAADWTLVGSATGVVSNGPNVPTPLPISVCEYIPQGGTQAFYVTCTGGFGINYTNGVTTGALFSATSELEFYEGAGLQYPFTANFNPRNFNGNIYYHVGNTPGSCTTGFPGKATYGQGCYPVPGSFYEVMSAAAMDLGGMTVSYTANGSGGFDVSTGPSTINPIGGGAQALTLGDDAQADTAGVGGTLGLHVGSNGWVAFGAGNSNAFAPSVATMLGNPNTAIYAWTDLQPDAPGSGQVFYEESGSVATVTYDGVFGWGTTDPNTLQFTIDTATGDFSIAFDTVSANNPEDWLIGLSFGGASADPGPSDLSAGTFSLPGGDSNGLALDSNFALIGQNWDLQLDDIEASPFAVFFFGDMVIDPGIDLTPIGGAGCSAYTNGNLGYFSATITGTSSTFSVAVPNSMALFGTEISAQGAAASASSPGLGFATSNGLVITVGQ